MIALCGSYMLEDFEGMSMLEREEREAMVNAWGKEYSMGRFLGVDEVERERALMRGSTLGMRSPSFATGNDLYKSNAGHAE